MADFQGFTVFGGYMTVEEIESAMKELANIHPDLVELIELPNKTWENRTSRAVRLHTGTSVGRPGVMFLGGMHAREWGTSDICIKFISNLLNSYAANLPLSYGNKTFTAEEIKSILDNVDVIVFPDVNPDGKAWSQKVDDPNNPNDSELEGVWWRKNRNPKQVPGGPYSSHNTGVDLNRNFDFLWESGIGTEDEDGNPIPVIYKGESSLSEPETKNVKHLLDTHDGLKCFMDIHCHVGKILLSWGEDDTQSFYPELNFRNSRYDGKRGILCGDDKPDIYREFMHPDDLRDLTYYAERMSKALTAVRGRRYVVEPSVGLYPTSATSQDYAFSQRLPGDENHSKLSAYTIEFGAPGENPEDPESTFIPDYDTMVKIMDDVCSALTELCLAVATRN